MWKIIQEVDLRPIRREAERELKIVIVDLASGMGNRLADLLRSDPAREDVRSHTPVLVLSGKKVIPVEDVDLWLVLLGDEKSKRDSLENWLQVWNYNREHYLVISLDEAGEGSVENSLDLRPGRFTRGDLEDKEFLHKVFVPSVLGILPDEHLALARQYPLFRQRVARKLISETCFSNAAYSLSTGLAEIVPVLDVPLNVADIIVLTKAQGFLVYKLGLALGMSTEWRDYIAEFSGVLGGGFLWRQVARSLVGLIPVWGIVPKVAVAYSGTYVVGHAVLQWYLTGKHLSRAQMRKMYNQAFNIGKNLARDLLEKVPRPKMSRRERAEKQLISGEASQCSTCGKQIPEDALFCQHCGEKV